MTDTLANDATISAMIAAIRGHDYQPPRRMLAMTARGRAKRSDQS
jgi:hypothetical protein